MQLEFDINALEDLKYWVKNDKRKAIKILELIEEIIKTPFVGSGKPEPLKFNLSVCWSRRMDIEHRLVYKIDKSIIIILSCRYHY